MCLIKSNLPRVVASQISDCWGGGVGRGRLQLVLAGIGYGSEALLADLHKQAHHPIGIAYMGHIHHTSQARTLSSCNSKGFQNLVLAST